MANQPLDYHCADEIPLHWVRGNQLGILLCVAAAVLFGQPLVLLLPLIVQLVSRYAGVKYNLFVRLFAPLFPASEKTEARELLRFNNLLAILMLAAALVSFFAGAETAGYVFLGMLSAAVIAALCGFCLGCFIYFQWKQFRARRNLG